MQHGYDAPLMAYVRWHRYDSPQLHPWQRHSLQGASEQPPTPAILSVLHRALTAIKCIPTPSRHVLNALQVHSMREQVVMGVN